MSIYHLLKNNTTQFSVSNKALSGCFWDLIHHHKRLHFGHPPPGARILAISSSMASCQPEMDAYHGEPSEREPAVAAVATGPERST